MLLDFKEFLRLLSQPLDFSLEIIPMHKKYNINQIKNITFKQYTYPVA